MEKDDYINLSDEEKIELIKREKNDLIKLKIIRSLSSEDVIMKCVNLISNESTKSAITYSLSKLENKVRVIEGLTEEKWITSATIELPSNKYKIKMLSKIKNLYFKNCIIQSLNINDNEIKNELKTIDDEKDLASIVARINNTDLKYYYLDKIKDEKNKAKIIISLDNEQLTEKYLEQVKDKASSTLLKASLKNIKKRNELLDINNNTYSNIKVPDGITIGMEIECEGNGSMDAYIINKIFEGYSAKIDNSLQEGVEITTPVLNNSKEDTQNIYCVCKILKDLGQTVSERCGGHIHIGANYLKEKQSYKNLLELWSNNEKLIYLISNKKGEVSRDGTIAYATPISQKIADAINNNKFNDYKYFTKDDIIKTIKDIQEERKGKEGRRTGINFLKINSNDINTIEFRLANGTIDANTWIENATLFGNIIATSQKLSEIQQKETKTEKDQEILNKFELLKTKDITNENRLNIFLDLCVPDEFRQVFIDRYIENKKILKENDKIREDLELYISNSPINLLNGIENLASSRRFTNVKNKEAELVSNYLEYKNPSHNQELFSR